MTTTRMGARLAIVAVATCVALALAPPLAGAKSENYEGPVAQNIGSSFPPKIELRVKLKKNEKKKFVLTVVRRLKLWNVGYPCDTGFALFPSDRTSGGQTIVIFPYDIEIKKRKFSESFDEEGDIFAVTGKLPKNGPATGTVRMTTQIDPFGDDPGFACDSGIVNWTADKQ